ncbi:MAG: hypothetical protein WA047_10340 [Phenylobacterium sp.]|uniref:hypothetical protein n=1 Tax=Phenylobacterium sp. TaxID=1871053 RepID=UPI003BB4A5A2
MRSFLVPSSDPSAPGVKLFARHPADVARGLIGTILTVDGVGGAVVNSVCGDTPGSAPRPQ